MTLGPVIFRLGNSPIIVTNSQNMWYNLRHNKDVFLVVCTNQHLTPSTWPSTVNPDAAFLFSVSFHLIIISFQLLIWFILFCFFFFSPPSCSVSCFSPHYPGCLVPSASDDALTHNAPPPPPATAMPHIPTFPPALIRPPLSSLPYLLSPSCISYSLITASLGVSRGIVVPTSSTPTFTPVIATQAPVKSDVPLVQDAAGTFQLFICHPPILDYVYPNKTDPFFALAFIGNATLQFK